MADDVAAATGAGKDASTSHKTLDDQSTDVHQELLTEHFGFHPRVFVDALVYAANEHMYSIGAQFEEFAKKQLKAACRRAAKRERENATASVNPSDDANGKDGTAALARMTSTQIEAEAERGVHGVLTLMENALDHIFDLLELYCLKTVFGVRPSQASALTLKHHRGLDLRTSDERALAGQPLTAKEECELLNKRELELRRKINDAQRQRHALRIANMAAKQSLARAQQVTEAFAIVLLNEQSRPPLNATTPQLARKIRVDAHSLVDALHALIETDPLGATLIKGSTTAANSSDNKSRREVMDASGATESDKRLWERGREAYINWEMDRIIRNVRAGGGVASDVTGDFTSVLGGEGGATSFMFDSPSKSTFAAGGVAGKRRRTTGGGARISMAGQRSETEHEAAQVGQLGDVEELADLFGGGGGGNK